MGLENIEFENNRILPSSALVSALAWLSLALLCISPPTSPRPKSSNSAESEHGKESTMPQQHYGLI